jgi:hypothetical protein
LLFLNQGLIPEVFWELVQLFFFLDFLFHRLPWPFGLFFFALPWVLFFAIFQCAYSTFDKIVVVWSFGFCDFHFAASFFFLLATRMESS